MAIAMHLQLESSLSAEVRAQTALALDAVLHKQKLTDQIHWPDKWETADQRFASNLLISCLRFGGSLRYLVGALLNNPLKENDRVLHALIMVGLCQLRYLDTPQHAALNETVEACLLLKKPQAKGLINAVLRRYLKEQPDVPKGIQKEHPSWLVKRLKKDWPDYVEDILKAGINRPPRFARVDPLKVSRETWLNTLIERKIGAELVPDYPHAVRLSDGILVPELPGFDTGDFTIQDLHAQLAAPLLDPKSDEKILDACAAPGGKTAHLYSLCPDAKLIAVDDNPARIKRLSENFERLSIQAEALVADARNLPTELDQFDAILCDAPCSATGVIRRHPEIKWQRTSQAVKELAALQASILDHLWTRLKPGGRLLYVTCSILKEENLHQMLAFKERHEDASSVSFEVPGGIPCEIGVQMLPSLDGGDGFYFALLRKRG